jgi:hypothetical protein
MIFKLSIDRLRRFFVNYAAYCLAKLSDNGAIEVEMK